MANILDTIVASKWREISAAKLRLPEAELERQVAAAPSVRDFEGALRRPGMQIIAEVKKASPSAGIIRADFDPKAIAKIYEAHGAACISVLTDEPFFQGNLNHLTKIQESTTQPLLRKDFILDRYQLLEARRAGADCVLLIAEILPGERLQQLYDDARRLGLHVLVELHDAEHLPRVIDSGATLIGINNRDLRQFATRLEHTLDLSPKIPKHCCLVSESGIRTHADLLRLEGAGVKAVLVGESLLREKDIGAKLDELRGVRIN
jgi:indole-3-glycerol phosphate synthase